MGSELDSIGQAEARKQAVNQIAQTTQNNQQRIEGVFGGHDQFMNNLNNGMSFNLTGSQNEISGRLDGLERAKLLTGKSPYEIGQNYQDAFSNIQKRVNQSDTGSELLRANKSGAVADARNQLQRSGVKGGSAAKAVSEIERAKSYDVNNQLVEAQRQAQNDYMNAAKSNANFTQSSEMNYGALAQGKDMQMPVQQSNGFGTVICTELYKQGYYTNEILMHDIAYGAWMRKYRPEVYIGYRAWADYVVLGMQKSKAFSRVVAMLAVPWAKNMAGERNFLGAFISTVGEPICGMIGKLKIWRLQYAN